MCEEVLKNTVSKPFEIIVCDDSSSDGSLSLVRAAFKQHKCFHIITHKTNQGIARTIQELYKKARYDYIILFSIDGDWDPNDIKKLIMHTYRAHADITIGKRNKRSYSLYRKSLSFLYNFLSFILFRVQTFDAGSIKVIKKSVFRSISLQSTSVFFEADLIIKAHKQGYRISSYPISFKRDNEKASGGKLKLVIQSAWDLLKLRFSL